MIDAYDELESRLLAWIESGGGGERAFESFALEVHRFQKKHFPAYARYCAGFPEAEAWDEIPALPQEVFKREAVRAFPAEKTARTFRTSGTTGEQRGEHHFRSLRLYRAAALGGWARAGLSGLETATLVPRESEAPDSSLSQMASWLVAGEAFFVRGGRVVWEELGDWVAARTEPVCVFGTALAFLGWFEFLGEKGAALLPEGSVAVETGGYKGSRREIPKTALYALFEKHLGLPAERVVNEYGMTELSSQFYARGIGTPHGGPPWARARVVDPVTGREVPGGGTGVLRIVDAANLGSCCAVATRDLAVRRPDGFELIGRDPAALPRGCSRAAG